MSCVRDSYPRPAGPGQQAGERGGRARATAETPCQRPGWRGPGWRIFDSRPACGRQARTWIAQVIQRYGLEADPDEVALVVSELFANAVLHGPRGGRTLVGYCLWPEGVRLIFCDGGGVTSPWLRDPGTLAEGGRGLHVVDGIATAWGHFRADSAQVVWCDLGKPPDAAGLDARAWLRPVLASARLSPAGGEIAAGDQAGATRPGQAVCRAYA
jgi:hypothetical protein